MEKYWSAILRESPVKSLVTALAKPITQQNGLPSGYVLPKNLVFPRIVL